MFFEGNVANSLANRFNFSERFYFGAGTDEVDEFFATVSGDTFTCRFVPNILDEFAYGADHLVAKVMVVLVVNLFEIVQVEHGDKIVVAVFPDVFFEVLE